MPTASTNRPLDRASTVATDLATNSGLRYGSTTTLGISSSRSVTAAQKASAREGVERVVASRRPSSGGVGGGWSVKPIPIEPRFLGRSGECRDWPRRVANWKRCSGPTPAGTSPRISSLRCSKSAQLPGHAARYSPLRLAGADESQPSSDPRQRDRSWPPLGTNSRLPTAARFHVMGIRQSRALSDRVGTEGLARRFRRHRANPSMAASAHAAMLATPAQHGPVNSLLNDGPAGTPFRSDL